MQFKTRSIRTRVTTKQIDFILLCTILSTTSCNENETMENNVALPVLLLISDLMSKNKFT
jgi:hypothetical protein